MQVEVKILEGKKWKGIPAKDMIGQSIASYMQQCKSLVIAALFDNDKPVLFVSNDRKQIEKYQAKGISLHIDDLIELMGTTVYSPVAIEAIDVFKDADPRFSIVIKRKGLELESEGNK